jgi:translation initiation factor 6
MITKLNRISFYGNPYVGLFVKSNNKLTLMPINKPNKFSRINEILGTQPIDMTIFDSPLIGLYTIMNDNGILFSNVIDEKEFQSVKNKIKENNIDINIGILESEFTALSNNIVINNKGCLVNPKMRDKKVISQIKDVMGVEPENFESNKYSTIGSIVFANNNGFVAHPNLDEDELERISEVLDVNGGVGTANSGVPFISLCLTGNDKSVIFGENTTAFEQQRIIDSLGFV